MRGTKQVGIWSEMGSLWQPHPTQDQPAPPGGFEIDPRIGAAVTTAPAASKVDSCPQAILKFHSPSSLDYRARHGLLVSLVLLGWNNLNNLSVPLKKWTWEEIMLAYWLV